MSTADSGHRSFAPSSTLSAPRRRPVNDRSGAVMARFGLRMMSTSAAISSAHAGSAAHGLTRRRTAKPLHGRGHSRLHPEQRGEPQDDELTDPSTAPLPDRYPRAVPRLHLRVREDPPAEADRQRFFGVTAPSVHRMVLELEKRGLIHREPGKARSLTLIVAPEDLPILR